MKTVRSHRDLISVSLKDKLDYNTAIILIDEVKPFVTQGVSRIEFLCGDLQYVTSAGIRALMFIKQKIAIDYEVNVVMHNVSKPIQNVFVLSGVAGYFDFVD